MALAERKKIKAIKSVPLRERVYAELRHALMTGAFHPGESVTIKSLSDQLEVGVTPVRDGVQRLAAGGALVITPNREVRVPYLTRSEFEDIYEIRLNLEGVAASKAANNMTPEALSQLEAIFTQLGRLSSRADAETILSYNIDFHFGVYAEARSKQLLSFIEELWLRIGPLMILPISATAEGREAYIKQFLGKSGLHRALLDRLAANDGDGARAATCAIIGNAADWYREHYEFARD